MRGTVKKVRELLHLQQLNDHLEVLPSSADWLSDEEPDFLINSGGKPIGVELTEYHSDQRETAREQEQARALDAAAAFYMSDSANPPLIVKVYWSAFARFEKRNRASLAQALAASVGAHVPAVDQKAELDRSFDPPSALPQEIDRIEIHRYESEPNNLWYAPRAAFVATMGVALVQSLIERKDPLVAKYRRKAEEIWLVIVFGRSVSTTWATLASEVGAHRFHTAFDRLFLVSYLPPGALELLRRGSHE